MSLSLPKTLIAGLDAVFQREAKKLASDIAKALKRPEKEVLDILKKAEKIQYKIYNTDDDNLTCPVFLEGATLVQRCRRPCILGTNRCIQHQTVQYIPEYSETLTELTRCICTSTETTQSCILLDEISNMVYNQDGSCIGELLDDPDSENKKILYEFILEDSSPTTG
jgi:hypothetical protein